jgi:hypothetical protein
VIQQILAAAIAPITNIFAKKVERKIARDELKTKAAIARQSDPHHCRVAVVGAVR